MEYALSTNMQVVLAQMDSKGKLPIDPLGIGPILLIPSEKLVPSIVQAPEIELKQFPSYLKYVFLRANDTLPVIVSSKLSKKKEEKLVKTLEEHNTTLGWTIVDIKGISPSTCMHRILLEDEAKPSRQPQRRLNPPMMEVVKKEVLKLLQADMIFPRREVSQW